MLNMKNPGAGNAGVFEDQSFRGDISEDSTAPASRQASVLCRRFALSPSVARTVAALAYGEAA